MYRFDHEQPDLSTGNPFVDAGYVEILGTTHEAEIIKDALELLVLKRKEANVMGKPDPFHSGAEELLASMQGAPTPSEEDPRKVKARWP